MRQRDYILRMIEQFAEALARIAGLKRAGKLDEAELLVRQTADSIFGPLRGMIEKVDAASAALLLEGHDKIGVYASLCAEQAEIWESRGEDARARAEYRRALELHLEAARRAPDGAASQIEAIRALRAKVDEARLAPPYRAMLDGLA